MQPMKRRQLLQFGGSILAAIAFDPRKFRWQADNYARVLAQNTSRKLALLVGVNEYSGHLPKLYGCLTDVQMQSELLVHRYGFNPNDIVTIADNADLKPTRQNILDAFENHLIAQAKPGDVVVFHYSGHGSRVVDPEPIAEFEGYDGTIIPKDGRSPENANSRQVGDIMGKTLFLLTSALQTDNVTVVLDSCHSGGGTRGDLRFRAVSSRYGGREVEPSEAELTYQQQWMSRLNLSPEQLNSRRQAGIAKGVALGSAQIDQPAADVTFGQGSGRFDAGAFTYTLTRYLWQQATQQSLGTVFANLARSTQDVANADGMDQLPIQQVAPGGDGDRHPVYFLEAIAPAAEAVVLNADNSVEFWLGGISSQNLEAFQTGAIFNLVNAKGEMLGEVEQTSRVGLMGYGSLRSRSRGSLESGTFLRERIRGVPVDLRLRLGLDASLGDLLPQVQGVLQGVDRLELVSDDPQPSVDYWLGLMTEAMLQSAQNEGWANLPPVGSLGLFDRGLVPIEGSFGPVGESIEVAVDRLRPRFKMLLAGRILHLVLNSDASELKVTATVESVGDGGNANPRGSRDADGGDIAAQTLESQQFAPGTEIQVQVRNDEDRNLYIAVLVIASNGDLVVLHPVDWDAPEAAALVEAGQTVTVPEGEFQFIVEGPAGFFELLILASTEPMRDALRGLQQIARGRGIRSGDPMGLESEEPVAVMEALLGDVDRNSRAGIRVATGVRGVDTTQLMAISAMVEVVE